MCGIAGILATTAAAPPERRELAAMIGRLRHRGPDGDGTFIDGPAGLAHSRLAIIDLAGGEQPIFNEDRSVAVVLNGEVFNYVELRAALLARGHRFATQSDTEVLVHLYEDHGTRFVEHLNGQFAIALWDARRRHLVLARDRTGMRPLFYTRHAGRFLFASEAKALFAVPGVSRAIDRRALAQVCTYWSALAPRSAFEDILSLPAGHVMVVHGAELEIRRYWDWKFPERSPVRPASEEAYAEELRHLLTDAVRLQLRADVPVGAYLSGGLDSAIIAAMVRESGMARLRTFSLTFDDPEFDESPYQRSLVDFLGTDHTSIRCGPGDIAAAFPRTIRHTEAPIVRTAPAPLMLLSGHVRAAGYKVVLTGEGADEVFGGYDLFKEARIRRFWSRRPDSAWRHRLLERLYPFLTQSPVAGGAFSRAFFREGMEDVDKPCFSHIPRWNTTGRIARYFSAPMRAEMQGWDPHAEIASTLPEGIERWIPMGRDQYVEAHTLMTGYLLSSQGDRVAMANSIEGRYPFLDHRVIEFANGLPAGLKLRGLAEKYLLKRSMRGRLPESVLRRTKQPYRAPDSQSFFAHGRAVPYVQELLGSRSLEAAGLFDPQRVGQLVEKCRSGRALGFADNMAFVSILSTMLLHEQLVVGNEVEGIGTAAPAPQPVLTP
jgi:asparagine synthase (glutamine-hydrolysing)